MNTNSIFLYMIHCCFEFSKIHFDNTYRYSEKNYLVLYYLELGVLLVIREELFVPYFSSFLQNSLKKSHIHCTILYNFYIFRR